MTWPRIRNGHVDDGSPITASNRRPRCPNCGSDRYRETLSLERCDSCGLQMDYWGGGPNHVYERYERARNARLEAEREERERAQYLEWEEEMRQSSED
jgi:ribosomal protein L37AE/L43A